MKWLCLLMLAGCTRTESAVADPSAVPYATPTAADVQHVADALLTQRRGDSPTSTPALGASCSGTPLCGTRGRVALQLDRRWAQTANAPCSRVEVPGPGSDLQPGMKQNRVEVCLASERLYLRETCLICRLLAIDDYVAIVTDLTPAQREHLRSRIGLPAQADLHSASDWKDALRAIAP